MESSNIQNILIALVVICAIIYGFIEFRKIHSKISELEEHVEKLKQLPGMLQHMVGGRPGMVSGRPGMVASNMAPQGMVKDPVNKLSNEGIEGFNENKIEGVEEDIVEVEDVEDVEDVEVEVEDVEVEVDVEDEVEVDIVDEVEVDVEASRVGNPNQAMNGLFISVESKSPPINPQRIEEIFEGDNDHPTNEVSKPEPEGVDEIMEPTPEVNYEELSIKELKAHLEKMRLSTSGNKSKLIERILSTKNNILLNING
jgi:hypothetical protein